MKDPFIEEKENEEEEIVYTCDLECDYIILKNHLLSDWMLYINGNAIYMQRTYQVLKKKKLEKQTYSIYVDYCDHLEKKLRYRQLESFTFHATINPEKPTQFIFSPIKPIQHPDHYHGSNQEMEKTNPNFVHGKVCKICYCPCCGADLQEFLENEKTN